MMRKLTIFAFFLLLIAGPGCTVKETQKTAQPETPKEMQKTALPDKQIQKTVLPETHVHEYPFTEDMENYHVRLEVNHSRGIIRVIIEEYSEEPVKLLRFKKINGNIILPYGAIQIETFRTLKSMSQKWISRGKPGVYMARTEWLKSVPAFKLELAVNFKGQDHNLIFDYQKPADMP